MFTLDWSQERPTFEDSLRIWDQEVFKMVSRPEAEPEELLSLIRGLFTNGGARFVRFVVSEDKRLDWFVSRNRLDEISFLGHLLASPALAAALPDVPAKMPLVPIKFEWTTPYILDGELAGTLKSGGAYKSFDGPGIEAKRIAFAACDRLFGNRYEDLLLYRTLTVWSDWFYNVAWDSTWIGVDKSDRTAWILCITDTD